METAIDSVDEAEVSDISETPDPEAFEQDSPAADGSEVEALGRLESRILALVDQLHEAREARREAERESDKMRDEVAEANALLEAARRRSAKAEAAQKSVRERIEALLDRVESAER